MNNQIKIIMYHYVRPIKGTKYNDIKGLELENFKHQLDFLNKEYNIITAEEVIDAVKNKKKLINKACWLTFDDGYKDHIEYVMPELRKRNLQGTFFIPTSVITEKNKILNVNSIHYILANTSDKNKLISELNNQCSKFGYSESEINFYWDKYAKPNRFDIAEVIYIKRMLQHVLPENIRDKITNTMFEKFMDLSKEEFSSKIYMNKEDLLSLLKNKMFIGSHGSNHYWLNKIKLEDQEKDIQSSLDFLSNIGVSISDWIMCYPYGAYNLDTLKILKKKSCAIGVTTKTAVADLSKFNSLELPRFDTNDFPQ
jgi:peptidoglycan/xylan/chitin deacetylase (PgdA/CDA1 family)|tara:strand:- start:257 stop:1189 length:933 start_codon:yes stop_codon:yes gene_type:complete